MENNKAADADATQGLYDRAMHAYAAWQKAEDQRDADAWESLAQAEASAQGLALDPTLLTTPAPVGACDAARQAYIRAYDAYYVACNQAPGVGLPDPAREPTQPLAWLPQAEAETTTMVDAEITAMTNRAIYANYPTLDLPPAEFTVDEFFAWDSECQILLVNVDDSPDDGPISIAECLRGGAIKAVTVKIGGTDQRLYVVQPGHYSPRSGFLHPGRGRRR